MLTIDRPKVEGRDSLDTRAFLLELFGAAVDAAMPESVLARYLPDPPAGRTLVLGAGKAAGTMAAVVEQHWEGELSGLVVTRYGQSVHNLQPQADEPQRRIEVIEAAHPVPDAAGERAALRMLELTNELTADDLVLCLISGGGSALMSLPGEGISLADKQTLNQQLLASGASISQINTVRKHLSGIKGGRLAAACYPARLVTLLISDVPGDDPQLIASGPTVPDSSTAAEAMAILERFRLDAPQSVLKFLNSPAARTPDASDPLFAGNEVHIIASPKLSLQAAAQCAESMGVRALVLSDAIEGESQEVGGAFASIVRKVLAQGQPIAPPCVILSGGETTVTLRGAGKGGPNSEFALALALGLAGEAGVTALVCDTDGIDGSEDNAGCIVDESTLPRAVELGLDAATYLCDNDAWSFFDALGDLVVTGPTGTNVNDFRAIYIAPPKPS